MQIDDYVKDPLNIVMTVEMTHPGQIYTIVLLPEEYKVYGEHLKKMGWEEKDRSLNQFKTPRNRH